MSETSVAIAECLPCLLKPRKVCHRCKKKYCLYHFTTDNGSIVRTKGYNNWVCHKCTHPK